MNKLTSYNIKRKDSSQMVFLLVLILHINSLYAQPSLEVISHMKKGGISYGICIDQGLAYVTNNQGVHVYDIRNPYNQRLVSKISLGVIFGIDVQDNTAYTVGYGRLAIVDVSDPARLRKRLVYDYQEYSQCLKAEDSFLFVASEKGLDIFDITVPEMLKPVTHLGDRWFRSIEIRDGIAYVANSEYGIEMIDVTDPRAPQYIAAVPGTEGAVSLHLHEEMIYVARAELGVSILSMADKRSPQILGNFCDGDGGESKDVWGNGTHLFVQDNIGVEVLDVTDPANPYEVAENLASGGHELISDGKYVYVASGQKGLITLQFKEE